MKKVLFLSIVMLAICVAACLPAHAEDEEEFETLYRDGCEVLSYDGFAYILKDGQATIVGEAYYSVDGDRVYVYLGDVVISTAASLLDCPGVTDDGWYFRENTGEETDDDAPYPLVIPSQLNGYPVVAIGDEAFFETLCTDYFIPEGITSIGDYAFAYCYYFDSIVIPSSVTSIGEGAFFQCLKLETVVIPASCTFIGDVAFGSQFDDTWTGRLMVDKGSYAEKYAQDNGISYMHGESGILYNVGVQALTIDKLATRSGPSTKYSETGTYGTKGEYVRVISLAYDKSNVCWVQCEVVYKNKLRRIYTGLKRFDTDSFDFDSLPVEYPPDEEEQYTVGSASKAMYGPGKGYDTYGNLTLEKDQIVTVIDVENSYAQVEWTTSTLNRAWIPVDSLDF